MNHPALRGRIHQSVLLFACLLGSAVCVSPSTTLADGIGVNPYRWVHPPKFYQATNEYPRAAHQTASLSRATLLFATPDDQVLVQFEHGSFGPNGNEQTLSVSIDPLRHFPAPSLKGFALDGNVYGFTYKLLPSGETPTASRKLVLVELTAPHTPNILGGIVNGKWRVICGPHEIFMPGPNVVCQTKALASAVALFYNKSSPFFPGKHSKPGQSVHKTTSFPIFLIVGIIIVVILGGIVIALLAWRRRSGPAKSTGT